MDRIAADSLLCASPTLRCPFFGRSLVLLADHGEEGSFGLVVNRPLGVSLADVVSEMGLLSREKVVRDVPVMVGGPVSGDSGFVLLESAGAELPPEATPVGSNLAISASTKVLLDLATGALRGRAMLCLGYAGWAPSQLEGEVREGSWIPRAIDADLVFAGAADERWVRSLRGMGIEPGKVIGRVVASA